MNAVLPTVWVVDDSPLEADIARRALAKDFQVVVFADGAAFLERATTEPTPDLLVLDWVMPGMSGVEVCRFLRTRGDRLPILMLTAHREETQIAEGLGAGANDFVSKPFSALELTARAKALMASHRAHQREAQAERERADIERQRADTAEERAHVSELFSGILGHDLRSPLSVLAMAATLIAEQHGDIMTRNLTDKIAANTKRMSEMINTLLDVTRSRLGGGIGIERRDDDLRKLVARSVDDLSTTAPGRGIVLEAAPEPIELSFDANRLAQVLSNLLTNAIQHGRAGMPIRVTLVRAPDEVVLRVINQGATIAPEVQARLFDPFRRGSAPHQASSGLGLGLYIAQQIVLAHGGTLDVSSGEEIVFTVRLPLTDSG